MAKTTTKTEVNESIESKKTPKKFAPDDTIECRSVTYGELVLLGFKSKLLYTWANAGDVAYVEYQDLQALQSRKSKFLTEPLFIIEDEDLVQQWGNMLQPTYSKIVEDNLEAILQLPVAKLKSRLKSSPEGIKRSIKSMAAAKIISGELDSINKIKAIDEVLGTDLMSTIS
jgi:hypothetical protein